MACDMKATTEFVKVFIEKLLTVVGERDVKASYFMAHSGELKNFLGIGGLQEILKFQKFISTQLKR